MHPRKVNSRTLWELLKMESLISSSRRKPRVVSSKTSSKKRWIIQLHQLLETNRKIIMVPRTVLISLSHRKLTVNSATVKWFLSCPSNLSNQRPQARQINSLPTWMACWVRTLPPHLAFQWAQVARISCHWPERTQTTPARSRLWVSASHVATAPR